MVHKILVNIFKVFKPREISSSNCLARYVMPPLAYTIFYSLDRKFCGRKFKKGNRDVANLLKPSSFVKNSRAKVVLPAPLGPARINILGNLFKAVDHY